MPSFPFPSLHQVRASVRVITMSIFKTEAHVVRTYLLNYAVVPFFANLVWSVRKQIKAISDKLLEAERFGLIR